MAYTRSHGKDAFCPFPLGSKSARIRGNTPMFLLSGMRGSGFQVWGLRVLDQNGSEVFRVKLREEWPRGFWGLRTFGSQVSGVGVSYIRLRL